MAWDLSGATGSGGQLRLDPVAFPELIGSRDVQAEQGFGVSLLPPTAGQLEPLLDDVPMAAFDFPGTAAQAVGAGAGVIQVIPPLAQLPVRRAHGRGVHLFGFDMRGQRP